MESEDFSNIVLKFSERVFLFSLRFKKKRILPKEMHYLYVNDLISPNYTDKKDAFGVFIPDGTYSLSDKYTRYLIYRRDNFFKGKLPVIISVIALLRSYKDEILWLLQELAKLLK